MGYNLCEMINLIIYFGTERESNSYFETKGEMLIWMCLELETVGNKK